MLCRPSSHTILPPPSLSVSPKLQIDRTSSRADKARKPRPAYPDCRRCRAWPSRASRSGPAGESFLDLLTGRCGHLASSENQLGRWAPRHNAWQLPLQGSQQKLKNGLSKCAHMLGICLPRFHMNLHWPPCHISGVSPGIVASGHQPFIGGAVDELRGLFSTANSRGRLGGDGLTISPLLQIHGACSHPLLLGWT